MPQAEDDLEIWSCPKCDRPYCEFDRYCGGCGTTLPFPASMTHIDDQEWADEMLHDHQAAKKNLKDTYCRQCGEKL